MSFTVLCSKCQKNSVEVDEININAVCLKCKEKKELKTEQSMLILKKSKSDELQDLTSLMNQMDLKSYSTLAPQRHQQWLTSTLELDLETVPGIGKNGVDALNSAGIYNTLQLIGKFLSFPDNNAKKFSDWLAQFSVLSRNRSTIVKAIAEKFFISMGILNYEL